MQNENSARDLSKSQSVLRSSLVVASMTMISRILGLVRDIVLARFIGAGGDADSFFLAFKIPNFFRRLFAEGAFSQAFVPVLAEYREKGSIEAVRHLIDRVAACLGLSLLCFTVVVVLAAPLFAGLFGLGYVFKESLQLELTTSLLRITFPYLFLISLTGLTAAVLNSYGRFAVPAFTPVLLNICLITAAALIAPTMEQPVFALAWAVLIAGVLQLLFQLPFVHHLGLLPHPKIDWKDESVRKVWKLMLPAIFGASVGQINLLLDTVMATFLPLGAISWLYFSDRLMELPLGVFGVGIATVVLPTLSKQFAAGGEHFSETLDWALRMMVLVGLPASLALIVLAEPLLFTLFQYGKTDAAAMQMATYSLRAYAIGLLAFMLIKVLASAWFSRHDTKTPVRIGIIAMVVNMGLNLVFVFPLQIFWSVGHMGLALATSGSALLNAFLLYQGLVKVGAYARCAGWPQFLFRSGLANGVMCLVLISLYLQQPSMQDLSWWSRSVDLFWLICAGTLAYGATLFLSGFRLGDLKHRAF